MLLYQVIYKGAVPIVTELGPYTYREYGDWTEPKVWDEDYTVPGQSFTRKGIKMTFNTHLELNEDSTETKDLDTPIWQVNQAAHGFWYGALTTPDWRIYANVIIIILRIHLIHRYSTRQCQMVWEGKFKLQAPGDSCIPQLSAMRRVLAQTSLVLQASQTLSNRPYGMTLISV